MWSVNDPRWALPVLAVTAALLVAIVYGHAQPVPAPRRGLSEPYPAGTHIHVPDEAPCTLARVQAACDRWAAHGWPQCVAQPTGGRVRLVVYDGPERGASAPGHVGVAPHACGADDLTLEHELGHTLYDLAHTARTGTIMAADADRVGPAFPEATP